MPPRDHISIYILFFVAEAARGSLQVVSELMKAARTASVSALQVGCKLEVDSFEVYAQLVRLSRLR